MGKDNIFKVTSVNQQGGITAGQVNIAPPARQLDANGKSQLVEHLPKSKKVTVTSVMGDGEAHQFATQIKAFLEDEGYDVEGVNQAIYTAPVQGQVIQPTENGIGVIIGTRQ